MTLRRLLFFALIIFCLTPWSSPPIALLLGAAFGLTGANPFATQTRRWSKSLLQASVVGLGFSMNLHQVIQAGRSGFLYTFLGIIFALTIGYLLGRLFAVQSKSAYLISVGTAICGGSAIAAVGPVVQANDEEMSVSIGTIFVLNAVGLIVFPLIGHALRLTETQFGLWAALAIHDTSSVVGAGAKYGPTALAIATVVKLARALWIVPLTLATAAFRHTDSARSRIQWPWFILFFLAAAMARTYIPQGAGWYPQLAHLATIGLTVTLFLIGTGITRASLKQVGPRPLLQGVFLWIVVAGVSLWLIRNGLISI